MAKIQQKFFRFISYINFAKNKYLCHHLKLNIFSLKAQKFAGLIRHNSENIKIRYLTILKLNRFEINI